MLYVDKYASLQIMLAPPYTISKEEVAVMVDAVAEGVGAGMKRAMQLTEAEK